MSQIEVIPAEEIKEHKASIAGLMDQMSAIKVTSKEELTTVAGHIGAVKKAVKRVKEARDKYIAPAKAIIDQAKADFDPIIAAGNEIEGLLKKKAEDFMLAEAKREEEAKKKILEDGRTKVETKVEKIGKVEEAETKVTGDHGTLGMSMIKTAVIEDESQIPDEYWIPRTLDMTKINKVVKAGGTIPGVKVEEKPQMNMRAK
jgi:hypothetical protein